MQPAWPSNESSFLPVHSSKYLKNFTFTHDSLIFADICGANMGDMFMWMPKEQLYVVVYLVTVMHSVQAGYMDKAQKYTDKALVQIEKLKGNSAESVHYLLINYVLNSSFVIFSVVDNKPILSVFQLILLEHIVMCRFVMGNKVMALQEMSQVVSLCHQYPRLLQSHRPQIHTLIGLYAMSMNCMNEAEQQFVTAIKVKYYNAVCGGMWITVFFISYGFLQFQLSQEKELWTFANLNLAIVYLRQKRDQEFNALLDRINPESLPTHSHSLRAAAYYVQGLQSFFQARYNEAK